MIAAGAVVFWHGRSVLVARIDEQIVNEASHKGSLLEQAVAEAVALVESLAAQPLMGRILDDDEDHEIAELLAVAVEQSSAITELTCFNSYGKAIAFTNLTKLSAIEKSPIKKMPDGLRYVLSHTSGEERIIVPVVRQFDEREQIGQLIAVIDRHALLDELDVWWAGLISESGEVLVDVGQPQLQQLPAGANQYIHPDLGIIRIVQALVKMPEGADMRSWNLAIAIPLANRYHPVGILGLMIALTTLFSSVLVLGVVHHFSQKQRGLLRDLSKQYQRLEQATMEIEGQKKEAESMNAKLININADLEAAQVETMLATKVKSDFLANMSHEIRTPMTAILGFADTLREESDITLSPKQRAEAIDTIHRNGQYLLNLINDILDMSKIEADKIAVEHVACSPRVIVTEVLDLLKGRSDAKKIMLHAEYIGAIPETILSDPTRLKQILINIIGNAIKFTDDGSVRLITRYIPDATHPIMQFDILDTGLGMTKEQSENLFQPFSQADNTMTRKYGGTGLGLTISKRFAEMLGGDITIVDSQPGCGTRFRATIATGSLEGVRMVDHPTAAKPTKRIKAPSNDKPLKCRILLAEDGPDNQRLITFVLNQAGAKVTVVENGQMAVDEAMAALSKGRPFDVILMDMQMPVLDGYKATMSLREKKYQGPIIALTAHAMANDRQKCIDAGCDDYATKPIDRAKLIAMIATHNSNGETVMTSQANTSDTIISELVDEDMRELVEMFVDELPDKIAAIEQAIAAQDMTTLATVAHQLKGSAGGYGFPTITESARGIEQGAKANEDLETLNNQISTLADMCRRARASAPTG